MWTDDEIISRILRQYCEDRGFTGDGGFTVVAPQTSIYHLVSDHYAGELEQRKRDIEESLALLNYAHASHLVDLLFARNTTSVRLTVESAPAQGYVVDYDKVYAIPPMRYTHDKNHSEVHGHLSVSLPAYDPDAGLILICVEWQEDWESGYGEVIAYKCEGGTVRQVAVSGLWIA